MKLRIHDLREDGVRSIIDAICRSTSAHASTSKRPGEHRRRMTVDDASAAIERCGFQVAAIVDQTLIDAGFRYKPHDIR
jgi:hypothetical protein